MKDNRILTVVDVGTSKTLTLIGRPRGGAVEVLGAGVAPSAGVQKGVVVDAGAAQESVRASVEDARNASGYAVESAYVTVTGAHLETDIAWGVLHSLRHNGPITEAVLARAMENAHPERLSLKRETLHKLPRTFYVDGLKGVRNPVGMHGLRLDVEALCISADGTFLQRLHQAVRGARLQVAGHIAAPVAIGEAITTATQRDRGVAVLDIGAGVSTLSLYAGGALWNTVTIPVGGSQFTSDLAWGASISRASAEAVKVRYGQAVMDPANVHDDAIVAQDGTGAITLGPREVSRYLHDRAVDLCTIVSEKLQGFGYPRLPAGGIVLTGGGSRLRGIERIVRQTMGASAQFGVPEAPHLPHDLRDAAYSAGLGALLWSASLPAAPEAAPEEVRRQQFNTSYSQANAEPLARLKERLNKVAP